MQVVELAMKGIRGFPSSLARLRFKPGLNVVAVEDARVRRCVLDLLFHTLFPTEENIEATRAYVRKDASEAKIAVSYVSGTDHSKYRLMRDAAFGATSLFRAPADSSDFSMVAKGGEDVRRYLESQERLPSDAVYERLFTITAESMPSRRTDGRNRASGTWSVSPDPVAPGMPRRGSLVGPPTLGSGDLPPAAITGNISGTIPSPPPRSSSFGSLSPGLGNTLPPGPLSPATANALPPGPLSGSGGLSPAQMGSGGFNPAPRSHSLPPGPLSMHDPVAPGMPSRRESSLAPKARLPSSDHIDLQMDSIAPGGPSLASWEPTSLQEKRMMVARLNDAIQAVDRARESEKELTVLNEERAQMAPKAESVRRLGRRILELQDELEEDKLLTELPVDAAERVRGFEAAEQRYQNERKRLTKDLQDAQDRRNDLFIRQLKDDPYFLGGAVGAVLSVVVAVATDVPPLALGNILGSAVAAGAAFRWIGDLQEDARRTHRIGAIEHALERLQDQYDLETKVTKKLIEDYPFSVEELLEKIELCDRRKQALAQARKDLEQAQMDLDTLGGLARVEELESRIDILDALVVKGAVSSAAGAAYGPLKEKLQRLESELKRLPTSEGYADEDGYGDGYGRGRSGSSSGGHQAMSDGYWAAGGGYGDSPRSRRMSSYAGGGDGVDRSQLLLRTGAALLQTPVETLAGLMRERLSELVGMLTDGAYPITRVAANGGVLVASSAESPPAEYASLDESMRDLVDAAIRLALAESCSRVLPLPILIDDPFLHFPSKRRALFGQFLEGLGQQAQVIFATVKRDLNGYSVRVR